MLKKKKFIICTVLLFLFFAYYINKNDYINLNMNKTVVHNPKVSDGLVNSHEEAKTITNNMETQDLILNQSSNEPQYLDKRNFNFSKGYFNENDINELFSLSKKQIEESIGKDYEIIETLAENSFIAFVYSKYDISIFYVSDGEAPDDYIDFIECGPNIEYYDIQVGMTYKETKELYPSAVLKKWSPEADYETIYYEIQFEIEDKIIRLELDNEDGPTTYLKIFRKNKFTN